MKKTLFVILSLVASTALAAESKIGYVDVQKAVQMTSAGKKAKETLDTEFQKRKGNLDKKKTDIEKMQADLEKKKAVLTEEVMTKKQMELQEQMLNFQKDLAKDQGEIQKKEKELVEPILDKMKKMIEKVAQEKGFSMVLEKQGQNVLFALKDTDLTEEVVKAFEKEK